MRFLRLFPVLFFLVPFATAQNATTSLRGTVKDPTGAIVSGATVTISDKASGQTQTTQSTGSGEYRFVQIQPAKYTITISSSGFADQTKEAELLVNQPATIDFTLSLQVSNEVVNVSTAAQTLNTTDASLGNSTDNATIQALPSETRNVPDLLSLQPGVFFLPNTSTDPKMQDSRSGAVNGGRSDQSNVTIDGVDDNDQVNGFAFTGVLRQTQDSIEEFRVATSNANADAGRSSGAQISLVTKAGTNKFHGAAYEYHRPTFTVANDWFNKQAELNSGLPNIPGKLIRNIFGGDVGGPILKDKLFFFANYEGTRIAENAQSSLTVPTASYQQGILQYTATDGSTVSMTPAQVAQLDSGCQVCNTAAYPYGPGPNPNALAFLNSFPAANGLNLGDGLNSGSFSFSSPNPRTLNTTIIRLDYIPSSKHRIFGRGNLQKDLTSQVEQFPGQPPSSTRNDNSKGMTFGDTWTISPSLVNDIRYGYIRQGYSDSGVGSGDYVGFRFLDRPTAQTRSTIISVPVNNIVDNFSISKGNHNIQIGGNWRLVHQNRTSDANSYNSASTNPYYLSGNPPDPASIGLPAVDPGFTNSYLIAYANLLGTIAEVDDQINYAVSSPTTATLLNDGTAIARHFSANEYEYYLQDSWRARPNLTLTFGIRHTLLQTPYETKGQQVAPTIDTHAWYTGRQAAASQGQIYEPNLEFAPNGPVYGKPGFWPKSKDNIAPRFAVVYAPGNKTTLRGGFGVYFDHFGQGLVNVFDQNGAFGLSSLLTNPANTFDTTTAPRFIDRRTFPFSNGTPPPTQTFPFMPEVNNFQITWGLDNRIKTPYSEAIDLSVQHQFGGFTLETTYVGRLGRHLLQQLDLAEPVDFVDSQGGGDYYTAGAALSQLVDQNAGDASASVPVIPYFEHVFPFMANLDYAGESATQAIYTNEWAPYRSNLGATYALSDLDFACIYCPAGYQSKFWQNQFSSLYALSTIGMSYYNAGQVSLHHPLSHGLQFDVSYTYSRSIDYGSDSERSTENGGAGTGAAASFSEIINTWRPYLNKGVSDFDTTHILTGNFLYQLPFGRGKAFAAHSNGFVDAVIGGWQLSGIVRTTSGLPFTFFEPGWTTNWEQEGFGVVTDKRAVKTHLHFDANGNPQYFSNPAAINTGTTVGTPVRLPYPGEAGQRNNFRGDGYFSLDDGLSKAWSIGDYGGIKFAWEVYNVTNTVRFDPISIGSGLTSGNLGIANALLSQPRRMQFSLRYDF